MKIVSVAGDFVGINPEYLLKMDKYLSSLDMKDSRYNILSYPQVKRLSNLMNETIPIQGRGNFPTLEVKLTGLVVLVKSKLEAAGIKVRDIRLNGSVASSVLAVESNIEYNDLDLIFSIELSTQKQYEKVKQVVLDSLLDMLPEGTSKERMSSSTLKEAYVSKMVKVTDQDRWSLIALGNTFTKSVELKFVDSMKRKYEFSVDSFHIILDSLFLFYECSNAECMSENFYPTVVGESVFGDFEEAFFHLENRLIATRHPEQIRGGGLLKYCNLLVKNYRPAVAEQVKHMERYMCSRFFIDFPDLGAQRNKLVKFLDNHFLGNDAQLKYDYLTILYQVVDESTVCLMGHERRQTLTLIEALSCNIFLPVYNNDPTISNSNWYNGGDQMSSSSSLGGFNSNSDGSCSSAALSSHSSRSSPAPPGSYSSPGSSSSYPSPAPSSASSSNLADHPSPMSATSSSPQCLSPKPSSAMNGGGSTPTGGGAEEWRLIPVSWVTLAPSHPPPPIVSAAPKTSDSSLTSTKENVTYHKVPVRSISTLQPPCCTLDNATNSLSLCSQQQQPAVAIATTCSMVGPPPSQPPPPPNAIIQHHTSTPPPPTQNNHQVVVAGGGHPVNVSSRPPPPPHQVATYEIITTCPPQMLYSNGNYYTAFLKTATTIGGGEQPQTLTATPCYSCSCTCQAGSIQWTMAPNQAT